MYIIIIDMKTKINCFMIVILSFLRMIVPKFSKCDMSAFPLCPLCSTASIGRSLTCVLDLLLARYALTAHVIYPNRQWWPNFERSKSNGDEQVGVNLATSGKMAFKKKVGGFDSCREENKVLRRWIKDTM